MTTYFVDRVLLTERGEVQLQVTSSEGNDQGEVTIALHLLYQLMFNKELTPRNADPVDITRIIHHTLSQEEFDSL